MNKKSAISLLILPILLVLSATPAFAVSTPDFGSCLNPKVNASQENFGNAQGVVG